MFQSSLFLAGLLPLLLASVNASPAIEADIVERNLPASECAKMTKVTSILKVHAATSFCSSCLGIKTKSSAITTLVLWGATFMARTMVDESAGLRRRL